MILICIFAMQYSVIKEDEIKIHLEGAVPRKLKKQEKKMPGNLTHK